MTGGAADARSGFARSACAMAGAVGLSGAALGGVMLAVWPLWLLATQFRTVYTVIVGGACIVAVTRRGGAWLRRRSMARRGIHR